MRECALCLFGFVLVMAAGSPALAQTSDDPPDDPIDQAQILHDEGRRQLKAGRYRAAGLLFEDAYALDPHPVLLWNAARAFDRAGDVKRAIQHYENLLALPAEAGASPVHLQVAEARIKVLRLVERTMEQDSPAPAGGGGGDPDGTPPPDPTPTYPNVEGVKPDSGGAAPEGTNPDPPRLPEPDPRPVDLVPAGWTLVAAGLVATVGGAAVLLVGEGQAQSVAERQQLQAGQAVVPVSRLTRLEASETQAQTETMRIAGISLAGVGALLSIGGALMVGLSPEAHAQVEESLEVSADLRPDGGGVVLQGAF